MANNRTVNSLGVLAVAAILGGTYFGVVSPILAEKSSIELEIAQAEMIGQNYSTKLTNFQNGDSDESKAATDVMELFQGLVPETMDIESASRAIAASLPSGVKLDSFDFGAPTQVAPFKGSPMSISGFAAPSQFTSTGVVPPAPAETTQEDAVKNAGGSEQPAAGGDQAVNPNAATSGFQQIPFTIQVSASSYSELAEYLNSLSDQPRLMSVVSVDSTRSDSVSAKIYAFAFSGK